jgi:hypothetical protein
MSAAVTASVLEAFACSFPPRFFLFVFVFLFFFETFVVNEFLAGACLSTKVTTVLSFVALTQTAWNVLV